MQVKVGDILLYAFHTTSKKINNLEEIVTAQEVITCSLESEGIKASNLDIYNFIYLGRVKDKIKRQELFQYSQRKDRK